MGHFRITSFSLPESGMMLSGTNLYEENYHKFKASVLTSMT